MARYTTDFRTRKQKAADKKAALDRMAAQLAENRRVVLTGKCPQCGAKLRRNLSLAGWWQCGRSGATGFKMPEYEGTGDCSFQCFTE